MPSPIKNQPPVTKAGFTLVELLVVMVIASILLSVSVPTLRIVSQANDLRQAGVTIEQAFSQARQFALSRNKLIQIRFYQFDDPNIPGNTEVFRALQLFEQTLPNASSASNFIPIGKIQKFPQSIILSESSQLSTVLNDTGRQDSGSAGDIPSINQPYNYVYVNFTPDGSTDLNPLGYNSGQDTWFLTVHENRFGNNINAPPDNFFTIQISPRVGTTRTFRP